MRGLKASRQRLIGAGMMIGGICFLIVIGIISHAKIALPNSLAHFLPADGTLIYGESAVPPPEELSQALAKQLNISWEQDLAPWASEKIALALIKQTPVFLTKTDAPQLAIDFLTAQKNPQKKVEKVLVGDTEMYTTPGWSFAVAEDTVLVSPSRDGIQALLEGYDQGVDTLASSPLFTSVHSTEGNAPVFVYVRPGSILPTISSFLSELLPKVPALLNPFSSIGFSLKPSGRTVQGVAYATHDVPLPFHSLPGYHGATLDRLPGEFDLLITGQSLGTLLAKIDAFAVAQNVRPGAIEVVDLLLANITPDAEFRSDITALLEGEFTITLQANHLLFAMELIDIPGSTNRIERLGEVLKKQAAFLSPVLHQVTLADGTTGKELIADTLGQKTVTQDFNGTKIHGITVQSGGGIFYAIQDGFLIGGNDITSLKQALSLATQSPESVRSSPAYHDLLQTILKNPDLAGIARVPLFKKWPVQFGFSKQILPTRMETAFRLVLE